ncbi:probable cytochrome P450 6a13 [Condylostylus longicornis]|uniref:probable cytochrome P450 6a13 n=1 Tax=Condylostylus longicornis TaxID=2530218 RepID=UPI00244DB4E7|nr:probable cytochrome P450 6a13 [Condylostylus longicornis]
MLFFLLFLIFITLFLAYIYKSFIESYKTWDQLSILNVKPKIPCGNFTNMVINKIHFGIECRNLYEKLKSSTIGFAGIYLFKQPCLFVVNPECAKLILAKDFNTFMNRGVYYNPKDDPLSGNIFFHENQEWKALRQRLSFAFTSGKMKMMFNTLANVGNKLVEHINNSNTILNANEIDIKDLMARFTIDVISSCIFGIESNCISEPKSEFRYYGKKVMTFSPLHNTAVGVASTFREPFRKIGFRVFDKESTNFFYNLVKETIQMRKDKNIFRNDLMQILMSMMEINDSTKQSSITKSPEEDIGDGKILNLNDVAANAFMFFFAGYDTSSTTLSVALYYLALNPDIQEQARLEIKNVIGSNENLTYENISELHLVERIVSETLRIFPPIATLHRSANKSYTLPNGQFIKEGTQVVIPVLGFHHDPEIYPHPEIFNPDRFKDEERQKRHAYSFIPFGEGNRICIGLRLASMQVKVGLISILSNFKLSVCDKTDIPLVIDFSQVTYTPLNVMLKLSKLD